MAGLFSSPKMPSPPPPPPPPPKEEDRAVQEAAAEAARRRKSARGFRSTILSTQLLSQANPALRDTMGS